jgi:hypothetical protein
MPSTFLEDVSSAAQELVGGLGLLENKMHLEVPPGFELRAGGVGELHVGGGMRVPVEILAIDAISEPKRARVRREDTGEVTTVDVLESGLQDGGNGSKGEYPLVDPRTTTIFQDYEDSFEIIKDWKGTGAKDAPAPAAAVDHDQPAECGGEPSSSEPEPEEHPKAPIIAKPEVSQVPQGSVRDARRHKTEPADASNAPWETLGPLITSPISGAMEHLVNSSRRMSFDNFKDYWQTPGDVAAASESKTASTPQTNSDKGASPWSRLGFSPTTKSPVDSFTNRMPSFDSFGGYWSSGSKPSRPSSKVTSDGSLAAQQAKKTMDASAKGAMDAVGAMVESVDGLLSKVATAITATGSGSSTTFDRAELPPGEGVAQKVLRANATLPLDICFCLPADYTYGMSPIIVRGPHGPLAVPVPEGKGPGDEIKFRLGPQTVYRVTVPEGASVGDVVSLGLPNGETIQATVPDGKQAGDEFEVSPSVVMVQVPNGANPGDRLVFNSTDGMERFVTVPRGPLPGSYFEVHPNSDATNPMTTASARPAEPAQDAEAAAVLNAPSMEPAKTAPEPSPLALEAFAG